ncbi:MAG: AsmA family protein [Rhodospirillales bacterium]
MKKLFIGIGVVLAALIGAVLIVPSFINWNDYKPEIAAQAKKATGRDLSIDGDIRIAILPAPALVANRVRFSNAKGAADAEMATLKSVEVRIAVQPLLRGRLQFETVKLIEPVISLEVLADGKKNWEFQTPDSDTVQPKPAPGAPGGASAGGQAGAQPGGQASMQTGAQKPASSVSALSLDNFIIDNGTVVYRDRRKGQTERIEKINARVAAGSTLGPFELSGSLRARGVPLKIDASLGKIIEGRTASLNANLQLAGTEAKVQATGALVNLSEAPQLKAKIEGKGKSLARVVHALASKEPLPGFLGQPFRLEGDVVASAQVSSVSALKIGLGEAQLTGTINVAPDAKTKTPSITAVLKGNRVDLDKWLALPAVKPGPKKKHTKQSWHLFGPAHAAEPKTANAAKAAKATKAAFAIPADVNASLNLTMDAVIYRGGIIHQAKANIELNNGEVTVSQVSAQLPGTTDVALFGYLSAKSGTPRFEGQIEAAASDLRRAAQWLGVALPDLPSGRLRRVTLAGKFAATPQKVDVTGLDLQFDSSRLTGAVTVALRDPLAFGANFVLDRLNLDAYLPSSPVPQPKAAKTPPAAAQTAKPAASKPQAESPAKNAAGAGSEAMSPLAALEFLKSFDANMKTHVRSLVYRKTPVKDIVFDGTLFNNTLEIRRASVGAFAGAAVNVTGKIEKLVGLANLKNLNLTFSAAAADRLFEALGLEAPDAVKSLGKVVVTGNANGSMLKPKIDARVQAAGADVTAKGTVSALPVIGGIDLALKAKHANIARLLRTLKIGYRPSGRLGALEASALVKGDTGALTMQDLKVTIGETSIGGTAAVDLKGARPKISLNLNSGPLTVDPFLPAGRRAAIDTRFAREKSRPALLHRAAWPGAGPAERSRALLRYAAKKAGGERWSSEPIDLSGLQAFDGDIALKAPSVTFDKLRLDNADIAMTLAAGVLKTQRLTGALYGGPLQGDITVNAAKSVKAAAALTVKNADISQYEKALSSGKANLDLNVNTSGTSVAQMVSRLAGKGSLVLEGLDVRSGGTGSALASVLGLVTGLNQLGGQLSASRSGKGGLADITGSFTIEQGVARSQDFKLLAGVGNGEATGTVDLPKWSIDVNGKVDLSQNLLTQLLTKKANVSTVLPFRVYGRLDAPNVKLDTSKLKGGLPVPGLEKMIKKKPGVGKLLEQVFPGVVPQQQQQQQQEQAPQQQQQQQQQKKVRPEDILKDLFKIR